MPALSRNCAKLLQKVGNQTHATQEDHHHHHQREEEDNDDIQKENDASPRRRNIRRSTQQQQPTPPSSDRLSSLQRNARKRMKFTEENPTTTATTTPAETMMRKKRLREEEEEDHMREPESASSSDVDEMEQQQQHLNPKLPSLRKGRKVNVTTSSVQMEEDEQDRNEEEPMPLWFTQSKSGPKSKHTDSGKGFFNLHAPPKKFRNATTYSKKVQNERPRLKPAKQRAPPKDDDLPKREFSKARIYERPDPNVSKEARTLEQPRAKLSIEEDGSMSPLSSIPSSIDSDGLQQNEPEQVEPEDLVVECAICGDRVDIILRQNFEDEFTTGRSMSYKWQQRFCRYHKRDQAQRLWQERGYPDIAWDRLEVRLCRYHSHLRDITTGRKPSRYRIQLKEMVKSGKKTALQNFNTSDGGRHTSVGYYGPRGEKAMSAFPSIRLCNDFMLMNYRTEHILAHLSSDIRSQAAKDKLVAASGVSGGVSGFVQLVLVPELAEQLLREDLGFSGDRLSEILEESAELGELLHPELNEHLEGTVIDDE